jgi:glycosyltransferase involved in cell wall biosynthesis
MKLLWVNANFLHPTTKGGQIRTLEMLRQLHRKHEVHYAAIEDPKQPEGVARAGEYSTRAYPFRLDVPPPGSPRFAMQVASGLIAELPVAISRFRCVELESAIEDLFTRERFDRAVCDFLVSAVHFPYLERAVLFQHNVETMIWQRRASNAGDPLRRFYYGLQVKRMYEFEKQSCLRAAHVAAVSERDAETMRKLFGVERVSAIPTGVDVDYFRPAASPPAVADLVFVGSMDWMPNIDGVVWFFEEVFPLIRARRPQTTAAVVGRTPPKRIREFPAIVTGTVPDVRPYMWGSKVSIVPLRIGGGTRLKIYEAMAAGLPVVSTQIGAEGLDVADGETIALADTPQAFADRCLGLLDDPGTRDRMAAAALEMVSSRYSWERVTRSFEEILERAPSFA